MGLTHCIALAAGLGLSLFLAGCQTNRPDPAQEQKDAAALKAGRGTATTNAAFVSQGAAQSKDYPKFLPRQAATTQMSDAEKKQFQAQMNAHISSNDAKARSLDGANATPTSMDAIGARHTKETLDAIEAQRIKKGHAVTVPGQAPAASDTQQ